MNDLLPGVWQGKAGCGFLYLYYCSHQKLNYIYPSFYTVVIGCEQISIADIHVNRTCRLDDLNPMMTVDRPLLRMVLASYKLLIVAGVELETNGTYSGEEAHDYF